MSSFLTETPLKSNINPNNPNNQLSEDTYCNDNNITRKLEFACGTPLTSNFCSNSVTTIPSSAKGILLFILNSIIGNSFHITMILILLFYLIVYICSPKEISNLNLHYSISFHVIMLIIGLIISFAKFIKIYLNDSEINNQTTKIYSPDKKAFVKSKWKEVKVGHIIRVNIDEIVPADLIILEAMDQNHQCYVDYSAVNGIFDSFVMKGACNDTHTPPMKEIKFEEYVKNIKGVLKYEEPNSNLHSFVGRLKIESVPKARDITDENFVMRGSTIKNIRKIYGLVVYTGMETKMMQTLKISEKKKNNGNVGILKRDRDIIRYTLSSIQTLMIWLYFILLVISLFIELYKNVICYYSFHSPKGDDHIYLELVSVDQVIGGDSNAKRNSSPFFQMFLSVVQFVFTFHFIFPFNWLGLIEIAYVVLGKFIQWDARVLLKGKNKVEIINNNCLADFGQVRHILTDKTGTLTSRKYNLKACSIHGKLFSFDPHPAKDENYIFCYQKNDYKELEIMQDLKIPSPFSNQIKEFFECLSVAHSVKVSSNYLKDNNNKDINKEEAEIEPVLGSCFAEERSMLKMLSKLGYAIKKTKNGKIFLNVNKEEIVYYVLGYNKYTEQRRRMSIIIKRNIEDKESILFCKANDFSIFNLCRIKNEAEIAKTKLQIRELTKNGLRFFIFCKRRLNEEETNAFLTRYKNADNPVVKSDDLLKTLAYDYERDLEFLGVLFFEEKVKENLKMSITKLNFCGIKVWVASGDKKENVLSVSKSLNLYNPNTIKGDFSDKDKPEDLDIKMSMLLMQFLFPNEKINKMKTRKGVNVEAQAFKGSKELTIIISGNCFSRICSDQRNFQSLATLLSYCTNFVGYGFNPNNKYLLCQMIRRYVAKNSKILAVGDGFNDFTMLKEADLSIGIRSNEILQVRNSCDVIVNKFAQITDLILIHGSLNFNRLMSISRYSFYSNFLIVLPMFLHQNANPIGSAFYTSNPLKLTLELLVINLAIIFLFAFDVPIERSLITLNPHIYRENFYDIQTLIFEFGIEFIKSGADSLILYYLFFSTKAIMNKTGQNGYQDIFGNGIIYSSYAMILIKLFALRLRTINYMHMITTVITIGAFIGIAFVDRNLKNAVVQGFSYMPIILLSIIAIAICFLYEFIAVAILDTFVSKNFLEQLTKTFKRVIKDNLLFKNYTSLYTSIAKEAPVIVSKIDKMTYPEVLGRLFKKNKVIDPALENMADVSNEEIAMIKIKKPFISFHDKRLEEDFIKFAMKNIGKSYLVFLGSLIVFWIIDVALEGFDRGQLVSKLLTLFYIVIGLALLFGFFRQRFDKCFPIYFYLVLTIEIICIYIQKIDNDTKICLKMFVLFFFPLFFSSRKATFIFPGLLYYIIGITPGIYLNDFGLPEITKEQFFLYSNLPLLYHRNLLLYGTAIILVTISYYTDIESRIEFLKYHKSQAELKKDNLIMSNLIPEFVREKLQSGERGAALGYETVTIVFCDIYDFDNIVAKLTPKELIYFLDELYSVFDQFCQLHGLQKIETVGKTYMAAGGIKEVEVNFDPMTLTTHHAIRSFEFGIDILDLIQKMIMSTGDKLKVKIGIHTGKVIPAVVGNHKPQFSLIGDAVNTTARMCAYSTENCINCSEFAYEEIKMKYRDFSVSSKEIKGKGKMNLYLYTPKQNKKQVETRLHKLIKKESSGNVMKSVTRNVPVYIKQGTKTSIRNQVNQNHNVSPLLGSGNKNNISHFTYKENSQMENSLLIIENSLDNLNDSKLTLNKTRRKTINNNNDRRVDETEQVTHNNYLRKSIIFFSFKDEVYKSGFARFERHRMVSSESLSMYINITFMFVFLISIYFISQYALLSEDNISLFIALKAILLILLVGVIYETKFVIANYANSLSWINFIIFLLFTIVNQIEVNVLTEKFYINSAIEEILIIITSNFNGMLSYLQSSINILITVSIFIINLGVNASNHLILKYSIMLIFICVICFVYRFILYYNLTLDFQRNQSESDTLVKTEKILFNLMPLHVVQNMKDDIPVADVLDNVTMLFADIVRFTDFSACHEPVEVVNMLSELFMRFDNSTLQCSVYKVHTIGDCYVVLGFTGKVPMNERNYHEEAKNVCQMGRNMISIIRDVRKKVNFEQLDMRIGIHTGPVIAGIIGSAVVRYDIFGSDVLIANKMESAGEPGHINISEDTKKLLETKDVPFNLRMNKEVQIPAVGREVKCYFIDESQD